MATSRATSLRQMKRLATTSNKRSLHMTGPATFPSPLLVSDRPAVATVKRDLEAAQKQADIALAATAAASSGPSARHFNTSRALKAVGDTSTIDFAYLPALEPVVEPAAVVRVPLLPAGLYTGTTAYVEQPEEPVMRPEIITAAADSTHIAAPRAFSEVHDNGAIDIAEMAERVASATRTRSSASQAEPGALKQVWDGFLEDLFGGPRRAPS